MFVERSLEGLSPQVVNDACPFWACTYTMSFIGMCKGHSVGITGENFLLMSFIKDTKKWL